MEARIARLESDVAHVRTDVADIKIDLVLRALTGQRLCPLPCSHRAPDRC
jgi:hypothetical protein